MGPKRSDVGPSGPLPGPRLKIGLERSDLGQFEPLSSSGPKLDPKRSDLGPFGELSGPRPKMDSKRYDLSSSVLLSKQTLNLAKSVSWSAYLENGQKMGRVLVVMDPL